MWLALCLLCVGTTRTLLFQMLPFLELQHQVSWMVLLVITEPSRIMLLGPQIPDLLLVKIGEDVLVRRDHKEPHCQQF